MKRAKVWIKDLALFTSLFFFALAIFLLSAWLARNWVSSTDRLFLFWAYGIPAFVFLIGYETFRRLLDHFFHRMFFRHDYDYQRLLRDASRGMAKIESHQHLMRLVVHFVTSKMKLKNAVIINRNDSSGLYQLSFSRGYNGVRPEQTFNADHPLIQYLLRSKEPLTFGSIQKRNEGLSDVDQEQIRQLMQSIEGVCCVPSFLGNELKNILVLGKKKSGEAYTQQDLDVLFTLAQESAIAIENARLFDEAVRKSKELEGINEQLEYSREMLMRALQETEVANKQLQNTQAQLIHEQKMATLGRLAASVGHEVNNPLTILSMNVSRVLLKHRKNPDLKVGEILELFQKMEQNVGRIKAVVNTLTGLLKRSEKGKFEPLSLKLILEETLPLVQFQTYLDNLTGTEVEFDVPSNIPLIRGDLERLQEVFLNLFINAYHAMSSKRNRRIRVRAERASDKNDFVAVHFTDNGSGMSDETMKKIFNYGYTTKPPGKGSGMGLYMCKYIIELHGGDIRVQSQLGQGTTFTLTLPVFEETSAGEEHDAWLGASG